MTLKFRSDTVGGALVNEAGMDVIRVDASGRVIFDTYGGLATTGDFKFVQRTTPPPGWIVANGQTIGATTSGATRANNDTWPLFSAWWADYTDAQLPILTKTGAPSSRGASAGADWDAEKRLTVFNMAGRFPRPAGTVNGVTIVNGQAYADTFRAHNHTHSRIVGNNQGPTVSNIGPGDGWSITGITEPTGDAGGAETAPASRGMLGCYKL